MDIKDLISSVPLDTLVQVKGWVRTKRKNGKIIFIELNDGSCLKNLQIVINEKSSFPREILTSLRTGTSCAITGKIVKSPVTKQSIELQAMEIFIYGETPSDYVLQKKRHSFEFLRGIAHLRPRTNTFGAMLRVRNALSIAIHTFFQSKGFIWTHTPIITASDAEGAGETFQVTTLNLEKLTSKKEVDYSQDFFGKKASLTVSGQLGGEALALALGKIYTFGPTFRAENSNTTRHLSEFWMIEPEASFYELEDIQILAEDMLKFCTRYVLEHCEEDMLFFDQSVEKGLLEKLNNFLNFSFQHTTYTKVIELLAQQNSQFELPIKWGTDLQAEHEKYLTEVIFKTPVIITDYPKEIKAFYMKLNQDGKTVRGMDVLVPHMGEIIGGSQREDNYELLTIRMKELNIDPKDYSWYLDLRRFGSVPHAGFGLGLERFLQYITGICNIRDVTAFPRFPRSISF